MITRRYLLWCVLLLIPLMIARPGAAQNGMIGPDTYPPGINPLTGQAVADPFVLDRRPIIVKVSNFPAVVRPQSGLMRADIVWEHLSIGGVTLFSAIYYGRDADITGPLDNLRLVDFELARIYRALSAYSDSSRGTTVALRADSLMSSRIVGGVDPCPAFCRYEREGLASEQTLFGNTQALRELADDRGRDITPEAIYGMAFSDEPLRPGTPVDSIRINYDETTIDWAYNPDSGRWERSQDGAPHFDATGDRRIVAANVVVIEADHLVQESAAPNYWGPGNFAFTVDFIDRGRIYVLRDGQYFTGEWRRAERGEPLTFHDADGELLAFRPGNTFFALVPNWVDGYWLEFTVPDPPTVRVTAALAQVTRRGPGDAYPSPGRADPGDEFALIGRNNRGTWLQLRRPVDGVVVWLPAAVLNADAATIDALPRTRPTLER